jgi:hypothetical protein
MRNPLRPALKGPSLDVPQLEQLQARIDAIRENVRERDGRELTTSEVAKLRRLLAKELEQEGSSGFADSEVAAEPEPQLQDA